MHGDSPRLMNNAKNLVYHTNVDGNVESGRLSGVEPTTALPCSESLYVPNSCANISWESDQQPAAACGNGTLFSSPF